MAAKGNFVDGMIFLRLYDHETGQAKPITQYHARIWELQRMGHKIISRKVAGKNWKEYALIVGPTIKDTLPPAFNPKPEVIDTKQPEMF